MNGEITFSYTDSLIMATGLLMIGIVMLIRGGDWTIDSAVYIARRLGIPPLVVGFTIVAFGTSLPELVVSINANLHYMPGVAIGNVLGSNIANILLVLGISAFFATLVAPAALRKDLLMLLVATSVLAGLMVYGQITALAGMGMVGLLVAYSVYKYRAAKADVAVTEDPADMTYNHPWMSLMYLSGGLFLIVLGAEFLVRGAHITATVMGVPEEVIGLTVIAVGTSLPELTTCIVAAMKKQTDIILGNVVGSNVFNILMIIGLSATVKPIYMRDIAPQMLELDIWITAGVSVLFTILILLTRQVNRFMGIMFLGGYVAYLVAVYLLYIS